MTMKGLAALGSHRRAVAAVEFAIIAPVLAVVLVGAIDYGFAQWSRSCLANAVAQGAYYAFLNGPNVSPSAVQAVVQNASSLTGISIKRAPTIACYCPTGSPASLGPQVSTTLPCTSTCPDSTKAGAYIVISATYTLTPWIPIPYYSALDGQSITESVTARLQ
jgi:Flp pilus assembly protein TadG